MPAFTLRPATPDDVPALTALIRAAFEEYRGVLVPPSGSHNESENTIAEKLAQGGGFVAFIAAEMVGGVLYYPQEEYIYLGRLAVLTPYRQFGVGKALVEAVESAVHQTTFTKIRVGVRTQLPQNRRFFERLGYIVIAQDAHPGFTEPTSFRLEKVLHE